MRRTNYGSGKNKKDYWICINHQVNGNEACDVKSIQEQALKDAFVRAMNRVIGGKAVFLKQLKTNISLAIMPNEPVMSMADITARLTAIEQERLDLIDLSTSSDIKAYEEQFLKLNNETVKLRQKIDNMGGEVSQKALAQERLQELCDFVGQSEVLTVFDDEIFRRLVDRVIVHNSVEVVICFRCGVELREVLG